MKQYSCRFTGAILKLSGEFSTQLSQISTVYSKSCPKLNAAITTALYGVYDLETISKKTLL